MGQRLKGKVAVVTGGGRGIGRGISLGLAAEGAKVVVNDIFRDKDGVSAADKVVEVIKKAGGTAAANCDNVASMAGGRNIVKAATSSFGKIDILVTPAGNYLSMPALEMTEEAWDSTMAVHLKGHFACHQAAALEMVKQKSGGRLVCFASRGSFYGSLGSLAYATAKAGVMGFSSLLARAVKDHGITVNCILPSADTQLFPGKRGRLGDNIPLPESADPDMVAPVVVYLATDEAKDITGQFIYASGGDVCIYAQPLQMLCTHRFVRKSGKWTVDEISQVFPSVLGQIQ
ncbi:MAG: SDR family NAD(P)-dependent oxidoreductase [Chloroflexota bacterium]